MGFSTHDSNQTLFFGISVFDFFYFWEVRSQNLKDQGSTGLDLVEKSSFKSGFSKKSVSDILF